MDSDKSKSPEGEPKDKPADSGASQDAPADALSMTPEELDEAVAENAAANPDKAPTDPVEKKISPIKRFFRKVNVYFLIFVLITVVGAAIAVVSFLNSQAPPTEPDVADQALTEEALQQLANTDASVGGASQTLTIQGNAIISGQTLMRGNLNVAGNLQTGGSVQAPSLTISGTTNLNDTQINSLQVATNTAIQGNTTLRDLSVSGSTSLNGPVTASQITVTRLIMSGNASLQVPNHISFTGASPRFAQNNAALGNGGSASINGSDTAGTITINSGNNPSAGCFGRVTFNQAFSNPPHVTIGPIGAAAGRVQFYVERDQNGFSVCGNVAASGNQSFGFDYFVTN
jgi:cytoskeletal protein RodZ